MNKTFSASVELLIALAFRLQSVAPEDFRAPQRPKPPRARVVGIASDSQKAIVTLKGILFQEHVELHESKGMDFSRHTGLDTEHRLYHLSTDVLDTLLSEELTNSFGALEGGLGYYIGPDWKVYKVLKPIGSK